MVGVRAGPENGPERRRARAEHLAVAAKGAKSWGGVHGDLADGGMRDVPILGRDGLA